MTLHRRSLIALPAVMPLLLSTRAHATPYVRDTLTALATGKPIATPFA